METAGPSGIVRSRRRALSQILVRKRVRSLVSVSLCTLLVALGAAFVSLPVIWTLSTSLKTTGEVFRVPPNWIPDAMQWKNYPLALDFMRWKTAYKNTILVTALALIGESVVSSVVAFGFSRVRAPGRDVLFFVVISSMMLPNQVTLIPRYVLFSRLGWVDTLKPLVVPSFFGTPFYIFLIRQFYLTIAPELDDAARIDGCGYFQIYYRIILPLSLPAVGVTMIQSFMFHWNEFLRPLIYLNSRAKYTAALVLRLFTAEYGATPWNQLMAASLVMMLPCIALFFAAQRYFVEGIVFTGVKG